MADDEVVLTLSVVDNATAVLAGAGNSVKQFGTDVNNTSAKVASSSDTMASHTAAIRTLGSGLNFLGGTALGAGIALEATKNSIASTVGETLIFGGAIIGAAGSAIQLVSSISKITKAMQELAVMEVVVDFLSGPLGWIAVAAAVAAAVFGFEKLTSKAQSATEATAALDKQTKDLNATLDTTTKIINGLTFKWTSQGWMPTGSTAQEVTQYGGNPYGNPDAWSQPSYGITVPPSPSYGARSNPDIVPNSSLGNKTIVVQGSIVTGRDVLDLIRKEGFGVGRANNIPIGIGG